MNPTGKKSQKILMIKESTFPTKSYDGIPDGTKTFKVKNQILMYFK